MDCSRQFRAEEHTQGQTFPGIESLSIQLESPFDLLIFRRKPMFAHIMSQDWDATLISHANCIMEGRGVKHKSLSHAFLGTGQFQRIPGGGGTDRRSALCVMSAGLPAGDMSPLG